MKTKIIFKEASPTIDVDLLKPDSIVGFIDLDSKHKGFVFKKHIDYNLEPKFTAIFISDYSVPAQLLELQCGINKCGYDRIKDAIDAVKRKCFGKVEFYEFATRKELFEWLST